MTPEEEKQILNKNYNQSFCKPLSLYVLSSIGKTYCVEVADSKCDKIKFTIPKSEILSVSKVEYATPPRSITKAHCKV